MIRDLLLKLVSKFRGSFGDSSRGPRSLCAGIRPLKAVVVEIRWCQRSLTETSSMPLQLPLWSGCGTVDHEKSWSIGSGSSSSSCGSWLTSARYRTTTELWANSIFLGETSLATTGTRHRRDFQRRNEYRRAFPA